MYPAGHHQLRNIGAECIKLCRIALQGTGGKFHLCMSLPAILIDQKLANYARADDAGCNKRLFADNNGADSGGGNDSRSHRVPLKS